VKKLENKFLFLVVLGGRSTKANIEIHDVRWVVGSKIEDTFDALKKDWFGSPKDLHIDSYKKIICVDGYKVNLINFEKDKKEKRQLVRNKKAQKYLWFVNIGGYIPTSMQEQHEFGLVVANSSSEAKNIAKSNWLLGCKKKHKDDIASLNILFGCDDCKLIQRIGNWKIELTLENNFFEETNNPDWYGYKRIDNI